MIFWYIYKLIVFYITLYIEKSLNSQIHEIISCSLLNSAVRNLEAERQFKFYLSNKW